MGNSGSSDVTIEKGGEHFFQTGDGVKLSPALIERMSSNESFSSNVDQQEIIDQTRSEINEAKTLLDEYRKIVDEREKQLTDLNNKWNDRLEEEKLKHEEFYKTSFESFQQAVDETEKKFSKPVLKPICEDLQKSLVNCYLENHNHTLNCSQNLKEFQICVNHAKDSQFAQDYKLAA